MARKHAPIFINGHEVPITGPGFRVIARPSGAREAYWYAAKRAVAAGYRPAVVRLHGPLDSEPSLNSMFNRCQQLWDEMLIWLERGDVPRPLEYHGTIRSLAELYQRDPQSPFHETRYNTQRGYVKWIAALNRACGDRVVAKLTGSDIRAIHREARKPAKTGQPNRERQAKAIIQMISILLAFGRENGLPDCIKLSQMMDGMEFRKESDEKRLGKPAKAKKVAMTYEQAEAIVTAGLADGSRRMRSVALSVAAQFEFTISQIDSIGYWMPVPKMENVKGAIISGGKIWRPGLCFEDFADGILDLARLKTGRAAQFDVNEYPLFQLALSAVPEVERTGPMVTDTDGDPMRYRVFYGLYCKLAAAAGVPRNVWNMRARHGGGTEARASGASIEDTTDHMQKSDMEGTRRDYIVANVETTRRVARKRVESRQKSEQATNK